MIRIVRNLVGINFKVFFRQPEVIFWAVLFPLLLFWILGVAFDSKKEFKATIGVIAILPGTDFDLKASQSDQILGTGVKFDFEVYRDQTAAINALKKGKIALFLEAVPEGYRYYFDPRNSDAQNTYLILEKIRLAKLPQTPAEIVRLKAQGTRYIDFFLPGLLAFNLMSACLWGIGWDLIEIRMKKYLKRLMATPIYKGYFVLGLIITRLLTAAFEVSLILVFAYFYFGISLHGNWGSFLYLMLLGNLTFSGVAILVGSRTANSAVGNGLINACVLPMMLTSGVFFNYHHFPEAVIPVIQCLPLTIVVDSMRAVFIENAGFAATVISSLGLWLYAAAAYVIGLKIFKWY